MTPQMYRITVPPDEAKILVSSDNYRRRVSILYRRKLVDGETPLIYIFTKNTVQNTYCGNGIFVLPGLQFQVELDKGDQLYALASEIAGELDEGGLEVSVVVETLEDDAPVETTRLGS